MAAGIDPRTTFLNCGWCARCRCPGSFFFSAVRLAGVRPHGRGRMHTIYHARPPGRPTYAVALRAGLVQPRCRKAAQLMRCGEQPARACRGPHGRAQQLTRAAQGVWCTCRLHVWLNTLFKGPKQCPCPPVRQQGSSVCDGTRPYYTLNLRSDPTRPDPGV